jgi:transposase
MNSANPLPKGLANRQAFLGLLLENTLVIKRENLHGDVYLCLKKNKQIKKLIAPALSDEGGWENRDKEDESKSIEVILPKTQLPLKIVILRDLKTRKNIRCFGSTNMRSSSEEMLKKYRYRWLIENGLNDLVYSYFLDEMYGSDPQKIEFEFFCVLVARLTYEYFLKELGGEHYRHEDGNKTLQNMRNFLFEKRNFTLEQDSNDNFILTLLDNNGNGLERRVASMLEERMKQDRNKVLWWDSRGLTLRFDDHYRPVKVSGQGH